MCEEKETRWGDEDITDLDRHAPLHNVKRAGDNGLLHSIARHLYTAVARLRRQCAKGGGFEQNLS